MNLSEPVPYFLVANLRISEQTTKFYLSFFTFDLPNDTNTSPTLTDIFHQTSSFKHQTFEVHLSSNIEHQSSHIFSVNPPRINQSDGNLNKISQIAKDTQLGSIYNSIVNVYFCM